MNINWKALMGSWHIFVKVKSHSKKLQVFVKDIKIEWDSDFGFELRICIQLLFL